MTVQRPTPSERPAAGKASQALSRLLDSRSLVTRLTRLNVGMLCLTVALCFAMLALGVHRATRNYQVQASTITAQSLSAGVASALVFKVAASADDELRSYGVRSEALEVLVLDESGKPFAHWTRGGIDTQLGSPLQPGKDVVTDVTGNDLFIQVPVLFRGEWLGTLVVRESLRGVSEMVSALLWQAGWILMACVVLASFMLRKAQRRSLAPIVELAQLAERVAQSQDYSLRAPIRRDDEVGTLAKRFNHLLKRIEVWQVDLREQLRQQQQVGQKFQDMAYRDGLTGLPNRRHFKEALQRELTEHQENSQRMAVMFIDLDNFKSVNDRHGHDAGDDVLRQTCACMVQQLRRDDELCRLGGDEFALIVKHVADRAAVSALAQRLIDSIQGQIQVRGELQLVGMSIGVAFFPEDAEDASKLLEHADQAMYWAKREGKNRHVEFHPK